MSWQWGNVVLWDSEGPTDSAISLEFIEHFDARGMRRVYGRGDFPPGRAKLEMDIWVDKQKRLYVRFSSRGQEVDWVSLEILGLNRGDFPDHTPMSNFNGIRYIDFDETWVPHCLKEEYNNWVLSEL